MPCRREYGGDKTSLKGGIKILLLKAVCGESRTYGLEGVNAY